MNDQRETISYHGKMRQVRGRLRYPTPPAPGTIVGPNDMGETLVIFGTVADGSSLVGLAIVDDMERCRARVAVHGPASVHERQRMRR
jgi:hypothetical protein